MSKTLMVQGSSSSAGKSLLVTALCRIYARRGVQVAPFKSQNMSNNAAVTPDGREIGRAQAEQAHACGLEPHTDMNPILLKPEADSRSQVVLNGRPMATLPARSYYERKATLWEAVTASLARLRARYELVIIEGAGSAAELNLKANDIVNMRVARHAHAPVLLVGDIDRGGIFAQLLGTLSLLDDDERLLVRGLVVNKFRGDLALFEDGVRILEKRGDLPVLGVVPYLRDHGLADEDAVALEDGRIPSNPVKALVDIAVIRFPRISNFDDFDPLALEPGVRVRYVDTLAALGRPQAVILPGTKSTLADMAWLDESGLSAAVRALAGQGVAVVGICGGYQMLGQAIHDPHGVESARGHATSLGLLPVETIFEARKATHRGRARVVQARGFLAGAGDERLHGYEIHAGRTTGAPPALEITREDTGETVGDGAVSEDGRVFGTCLHGLFANDAFRRAWLHSLGWNYESDIDAHARREAAFDRLADAIESALDMEKLDAIIGW
jgi:adenosylcobyric acid synthase